ncbi:AAA family ATPase [Luoshenia tenuis]|jgi:MoxR-like ATPase|uniref:AAA family ATPase n=1 Tax=Luoshenia tenuis TaxID=2763654 RepID=UPI003D90260C
MQDFATIASALRENIQKVIIGKTEVVDLMLIAMACKGHILIEDVPGVGKTTIVSCLAKSLQCDFKRIQFTPDILPSDITGFSMANMRTGEFEFHSGAIMSQIVLADEINRASPKTQSALLEVMEENQVTVDGVTYAVPQPFLVLATQNPVEYLGTYPLPEAQLDRFFMRLSIGYPSVGEEVDILSRFETEDPMESLSAIATGEDILALQQQVRTTYVADEIKDYIARITAATREQEFLQLGASPRGALYLMRAAQARARMDGRDYVQVDDVQKMAYPVLCHRLILRPEAKLRDVTAERVMQIVLGGVSVPSLAK